MKFFKKKHTLVEILSVAAFVCYGLSLLLSSFKETGPGIFDLFMGWASLLFGLYFAFAAWSANVFMLIAFISQKRSKKVSLLLSLVALLLAIFAFKVEELPVHMGSTTSAVELGIGGYLWFLAMVLLFLRFFLLYRQSLRNRE